MSWLFIILIVLTTAIIGYGSYTYPKQTKIFGAASILVASFITALLGWGLSLREDTSNPNTHLEKTEHIVDYDNFPPEAADSLTFIQYALNFLPQEVKIAICFIPVYFIVGRLLSYILSSNKLNT